MWERLYRQGPADLLERIRELLSKYANHVYETQFEVDEFRAKQLEIPVAASQRKGRRR